MATKADSVSLQAKFYAEKHIKNKKKFVLGKKGYDVLTVFFFFFFFLKLEKFASLTNKVKNVPR